MNTQIIEVVKEVIELIIVINQASENKTISFLEKLSIANQSTDILQFIGKLEQVATAWKGMSSKDKVLIDIEIYRLLFYKTLQTSDTEKLIDIIMDWAAATAKIINVGKDIKQLNQ